MQYVTPQANPSQIWWTEVRDFQRTIGQTTDTNAWNYQLGTHEIWIISV